MASKVKDLPFIPSTAYATIVKYSRPSGTAGTTLSKAWNTLALNTVEGDTDYISLSSNQMNIKAGSYAVFGSIQMNNSLIGNTRIIRSSDSVVLFTGSNNIASGSSTRVTSFLVQGVITFTEDTTCEIQFSTSGNYGKPVSFGINEVYQILTFVRV